MTEKFPDVDEDTDITRKSISIEEENGYFGPNDAETSGASPAGLPPEDAVPRTPATEQPPSRAVVEDAPFLPLSRHQSAIRLRRLRGPALPSQADPAGSVGQESLRGRRRSSSEPQRPAIPAATALGALPTVAEAPPPRARNRRSASVNLPARPPLPQGQALDSDCYDSKIVDFLDVVDPEVATLSSITNIQNSLFVPSLGRWVNRRPTYELTQFPQTPGAFLGPEEDMRAAESTAAGQSTSEPRSPNLASVLSQPQYAILPNDASLEGWPEEDIKALNNYVRHMLHSRRSKIKQRLKAFGKYIRRPLGFLVTLYATLITLFGLAWVLFLIGWIYVGHRQYFAIQVIDYTLVALFGIVGDGLAPFRAINTYHMIFVAHYHRKTWKLRKKLLLPELQDSNDLPTASSNEQSDRDLEDQPQQGYKKKDEFFPVLSEKEQSRLVHHQTKLAKSHTFYKPHETETHHAFPLRFLIAVVLLLDLHSCLQISLGICTWAVSAHRLSAAVTTTILCCSIATNIVAGTLITIGDRRTRKRDVLERLLKQDLTGEVMKKMRKKKEKEAVKEGAKRESMDGAAKPGRSSLTAHLRIATRTDKNRKSNENGACSHGPEASQSITGADSEDQLRHDRSRAQGAPPGSW
ncbi:hypothetical protein MYCTH_2311261 [Thermothelomyces thermophilus ATCC 42464]|uniref:Integral membrane protein n=1 Tax=Thermothelomyces thermophilus (strain ATCC 42464 / BCRC 31852 / DSM 1799) TaxID=573729 RepID=G2QNP1_THET4|nr:uncharacterized protein MYCTH_2311261 [Thermothelomyces thermophilus ATCC 42464]AEO61265.1 hypothetical protein MYCTH_2311261 [Thermothelomyces thermophilus ATCC 42464]